MGDTPKLDAYCESFSRCASCNLQSSGNPFLRSRDRFWACSNRNSNRFRQSFLQGSPGLVQEVDVLRITDVLRSAGYVKNDRFAVFRFHGRFVGIASASDPGTGIVRRVVIYDHLVDLDHDLVIQALTEFNLQRRDIGRFTLKPRDINEVLVIHILRNLFQHFSVK